MLDQILKTKKDEVRQLYASNYHYQLTVQERPIPTYSFMEALQKPKRRSALIAEIKKASPSKGVLRKDFHPVQIAQAYERAGADCLSVLTDQTYFQGDPSFIAQIKEKVQLPVLRKDFIVDPLQIQQSVELGADAILLIAKALSAELLADLYELAGQVGLDCLIEVSTREEIQRVFSKIKPKLIGINNRDLTTFSTSPEVTKTLLPYIPEGTLVISESGIHDARTMRTLEQLGVNGFLIGEYLMRQNELEKAVAALYT